MRTWLVERLKERSTWAGLTAFLTAAGFGVSPEQGEAIASAGLAIGGLIFTLTADRGGS